MSVVLGVLSWLGNLVLLVAFVGPFVWAYRHRTKCLHHHHCHRRRR